MKTKLSIDRGGRRAGYALMEILMYFAVVTLVLGCAFFVSYRAIDTSAVLRRNAEDIARTLHVGELWRADLRKAQGEVRLVNDPGGTFLEMPGPDNHAYLYSEGTLFRRSGDGPWVSVLQKLKACEFIPETRAGARLWRCELELQPRQKGAVKAGRVRPLFSFIAATKGGEAK